MSRLGDERGIIARFLIRIVVSIAVVSVVAVDVGSVLFTRFQAQDTAEVAAAEAAMELRRTGDRAAARGAAGLVVAERGGRTRLRRFQIRPDGAVHVEVVKPARTLVAGHIEALRRYTIGRGSHTARPPA